MTIIILVFAEILPKTIAKENADKLSLKYAGVLYFHIKLLQPINYLSRKLSEFCSHFFGERQELPSITEEEIKLLVEMSKEEGVINEREKQLIHRSLELKSMKVGEILIPVTNVVAVDVNQSIEEIKRVFLKERYARVLVYEDTIDHIIGYLKEREFFSKLIEEEEIDVQKLLRNPLFIQEDMTIASILPQFQKQHTQMAVVVDDERGTTGIITLEDILEVLVGKIWDEHEANVTKIKKINESLFQLDSRYQLKEFATFFQVPLPATKSNTLGGWIYEKYAGIPKEGQTFQYKNLIITIHGVENHRIQSITVEVV